MATPNRLHVSWTLPAHFLSFFFFKCSQIIMGLVKQVNVILGWVTNPTEVSGAKKVED